MFAINRMTGLEIVSQECVCTQTGRCGVLVEQERDGTWVLDDDSYGSFENESGDEFEPQDIYYDSDDNACTEDEIEFVEVLPESHEDCDQCDVCGIECPGGGTCDYCLAEDEAESDSDSDVV